MKVLCAGGGSGGHVTPVLAVINELKRLDPSLEAAFVCDRAFESQSRGLMNHATVSVPVHVIHAGKLRRYYGVPLWKQLLDIPTVLKNIRDVFLIGIGFVESLWLLARSKPDVVFAKGGYVCLPLGYAARALGIPLVIHDSDTRPGLTNRQLGRFANAIATGSPLDNYDYPEDRSVYTGVPIDKAFHPFTREEQQKAKHVLGFTDLKKPLVVFVGGGLGAESINSGVLTSAQRLLNRGFLLYHVTGKKHYSAVKSSAVKHAEYMVVDFVYKDMVTVLGAADIVVSRGSATFLQELAALGKPTIIVPASHLGDQVKNARVYEEASAAVVLDDASVQEGDALLQAITELWREESTRQAMAKRFRTFAKDDAATVVAELVLKAGKGRTH
ncbi:TPA: hypothetical protein DCF80_02560 [Candidatus Saccharibacteria bacterium]|nr:hypothetical protein [Candidatus Saccharibacteria bacterium]HRK41004.1 UDP-N-acetylglucosamine--N-acetylmuramyl-(pentapeptide) pyrophosphoryl-undecaprenol N-acetylglucosamine transferase [Candidatus Saccharibacteria bacterium]